MGKSVDWLSKVERGERQIERLGVLKALAEQLRVDLADLVGQPVLLEVEDEHAGVSVLRAALVDPARLSRHLALSAPVVGPVEVNTLWNRAWDAWDSYQAGRLGILTTAFPVFCVTSTRQ